MIVVCGPIAHSSPIVVSPFRLVPGSIVVSWPIVTSASISVLRRVDDRDAVAGVAVVDLALREGSDVGQVDAVVDARA